MMEVGEEAVAASDDDSLPEFFKVYITLHSSQKLLIPREFVNYLNEKKSGHAKLAGPSGKTWRVELVEEGEDVYFTDGWQAFVNDNMVQDGEFLFFKLHGSLMFSVTIYDDSMCEKQLVSCADKCSEGKDKAVKSVKRRSLGHSQPKGSLFASKAKDQSPSVNPSFEKRILAWSSSLTHGCYSYLTFPSSFVQEHSLNYKSHEKMILQTSKNSTWEVTVMNSCGAIILRKGWNTFTRDNNIRTGDVCKFELLNRLKMLVHVKHRQAGSNQKKEKLPASKSSSNKPELGSSSVAEEQTVPPITVQPFDNPIFVTRMKKYNVNRGWLVRIPSWFVQENSLHYEGKEKMVLRTETDAFWPVNIINNFKNCFFCGGWAAFVHENDIKEGDTCKFELVKRLEMKVYITHCSQQD